MPPKGVETGSDGSSLHERARTLTAERLFEPLDPDTAAWLDGHLAGCLDCRVVDTEYQATRAALKALTPPVPPRDLWARTSAALDREDAKSRRSWRIPGLSLGQLGPARAPLGAIVAVVVVAFVASSTFFPAAPSKNGSPSGAPTAASSVAPATPITVPGGDVSWVTSSGNGAFVISHSPVEQVCPASSATPCATIDTKVDNVALVAVSPRSIYGSPVRDQVVVLGQKAGSTGFTMYVMSVAAGPHTSATPGPTASPSSSPASVTPSAVPPSSSVTPTPTPAAVVTPTPSGGAPTPTPLSSPVEPSPSAAPQTSASPTPSIVPSETPVPTAAAVLAIASDLVVVGQTAAYSPDGTWFAFNARSVTATVGSDIYVWRAGEPLALPATSDGRSVFSGWVGDRLVGSRVDAAPAAQSPAPSDAAASSVPSASPADTSPTATSDSSAAASDGTTGSGGSAAPSAAGSAIAGDELTASSFLLDPATGVSVPLSGRAWRPVVDPAGRFVVYWDGSIVADPTSGGWTGATGRLVVGSWPTLAGAAIGAAAPGSPGVSVGASAAGSADTSVTPVPPLGPTSSAASSPAVEASASPGTSASPATDATATPDTSPSATAALSELPAVIGSATGLSWDAGWDETGTHLAIWIGDPGAPGGGHISLITIDPTTGRVALDGSSLVASPALPGFSLSDGHLAWATPPDAGGAGSHLQVFAWSGPHAGQIDSQPASATDTIIVVQH